MKGLFKVFLALVTLSGAALSLTVTEGSVFGYNTWEISWADNVGSERTASYIRSGGHAGTIKRFTYYVGSELKEIVPGRPDSDPYNGGFGATVHHSSNSHHVEGNNAIVFQSTSMLCIEHSATIDGAHETVTYIFRDGQDYFQWANTIDARAGTENGDSRGPYCTIKWNVTGNRAQGVEYAAAKYFSQPVYNEGWTFTGDATRDVPYCMEWGDGLEVGYVQSQTFNQQVSGNYAWSASRNLPESGSRIDWNYSDAEDNDPWMFDYQMNFYDNWAKITWGTPWGTMNNSSGALNLGFMKNGWAQYSLSIIFDAQSQNGIRRVLEENRAVHSGSVSLSASTGTVKTQGPVGTVNPALQTLSPAGYDHNYRAWWLVADNSAVAADLTVGGSTPLVNPTFRIEGMEAAPEAVSHNGSALTQGD
jgi:hypothetical protein